MTWNIKLKDDDIREDTEREERSVHIIMGSEQFSRLRSMTMN